MSRFWSASPRDQQFLEWGVPQYGVPIDVMAKWYGSGRSWTYELGQKLEDLGKVERVYATELGPKRLREVNGAEDPKSVAGIPRSMWGPMWFVPTRPIAAGILGWDPGHWTVRPSRAAHVRALTELRLALTGRDTSPHVWRSERQLRHDAAPFGPKIGEPQPYCHDGLFRDDSGKVWAVEVELSVKKGRGRMESILRTSVETAYNLTTALDAMDATKISGVIYFCRSDQVANHVTRAKEKVQAEYGKDAVRGLHIRDLDTILTNRRVAA